MTHFTKYMHIERYPSSEVDSINHGKVYIFPKLDGTNASLWVEPGEDGKMHLKGGSRNNVLTKEWDNQGFYTYALAQTQYLEYLRKHPMHIIYGEFLVKHTIKDYDVHAWGKLYVFDVLDTETGKYLPYEEYRDLLTPYGFNIIPPLAVGHNLPLRDEDIKNYLQNNHYLMIDDEHIGEGIVIKNYDYVNPYGRTIWGKVVNPTFKQNSKAKYKGGDAKTIEDVIIEKLLTEDAINHEVLKFKDEYGEIKGETYSKMLGLVWYGWMQDNWWNIIRLAGKSDLNFAKLHKKVIDVIKLYYPI